MVNAELDGRARAADPHRQHRWNAQRRHHLVVCTNAVYRVALSALPLLSGLKLVNVPTLAVGIVLLISAVAFAGAWLTVRVTGRTPRELNRL